MAGMVTDLGELVGRRLLFSVRYVAADGTRTDRYQACGTVTEVEPDGVVTIDVPGADEPFTLPADPEAYDVAAPGEYRLHETGEVVVDPDYTSTWTVRAPGD